MPLGLKLFLAATLGVACFAATAHAKSDADGASDDEDKADPSEESESSSDDQLADEHEPASKPAGPRFEMALNTTLASYSKISYTVDIPVVGKVDGAISYTVFGPSANPVTIEVVHIFE